MFSYGVVPFYRCQTYNSVFGAALQGNNCCSSKDKIALISALGMKHPIYLVLASS